jgi:uncharacterized caspase-like protein
MAAGVLLHVGCAGQDRAAPAAAQIQSGPAKADDFLVVDCLLPGQLRKLGRQLTYLGPRRAIKTSARDCEIRGGEYVAYDRANYATALKVWLPLAEQGDAPAQTYVGEIFEKGLGVPPDYDAAATWYRRAAESGYSRAAINLGNLFEQGLGVAKDPAQALNWYRRAAGLSQLTFEIVPGKTEAELQGSRIQIAQLRSQLDAKQIELEKTQGELEPARRRLEDLERDVKELRAKLESPAPSVPDKPGQRGDAGGTERRKDEAALAAKEKEIAVLSERIGSMETQGGLKQEVANLRQALVQAEAELVPLKAGLQSLKHEMAQGGPRIEFKQVQLVEPEIIASTRDIQVRQVAVPAGTRSWIVVGRVASDAVLKSLAINERQQPLNRENVFRIHLAVADRQLRIVATDRQDRRSTQEWLLPAVGQDGGRQSKKDPILLTLSQRSQLARSLGTYHALVIGNNNYRQVAPLRTPVNDAQEVAKVLREQYRFRVTLLTDSTRYDMLSALNELRGKLTKEDNLLIYYAGHGHLDARSGRGYWLPVDAEANTNTNWIANEDITSILDAMQVRQLLLVADSCYSGTLSGSAMGKPERGKSQEQEFRIIEQMAQKRSRVVMTSGGVQPVLDSGGGTHSVFAEVFLNVLRDNDGVLLGQDLFGRVQLQVAEKALAQQPQYAPIKAGHEVGDFVFARPAS